MIITSLPAQDLQKLLRIFKDSPLLYNRVCIISFYITALYRVSTILVYTIIKNSTSFLL